MINIDNVEVLGWEHAIRGMRNPKNSWINSDSAYCDDYGEPCSECSYRNNCSDDTDNPYVVGKNDYDLMTRLRNAGTDHRKFMRMITVYADINAPLYWWKEYDTYKVGTVANSCSTMHKIHDKEFTLDDFSCEHLSVDSKLILGMIISELNHNRKDFIETKDKSYWWQMIQLLPTSYNQKRTVMLNYEVLANMYKSRKAHKLDEWHTFCDWIKTLPYSELITGENNNE